MGSNPIRPAMTIKIIKAGQPYVIFTTEKWEKILQNLASVGVTFENGEGPDTVTFPTDIQVDFN